MRLLLAAAVALAVPGGYVNPTPGREVALQIPGMHEAEVRRDLVYAVGRRMDVYRPPRARGALPAVLFVHGTGGPGVKDAGVFVGWGQLAAASGLAGVVFDNDGLQTDVQAAIRYVRRRATDLGIDASRLCVAGYSAGVLPSMLVALKGQARLRCAVAYYGPLDAYYEQSSPLTYLKRSSVPVLVAKAGRDGVAINTSIDRFVAKGKRVGARVELLVQPAGHHGFDAHESTPRSRAILRRTLAFLRTHLRR